MKVQVQVDQAVWERTTFEVEVDDGLEGEELQEAIREKVNNFEGYGEPGYQQRILDEPVYSISAEREATLPDGSIVSV